MPPRPIRIHTIGERAELVIMARKARADDFYAETRRALAHIGELCARGRHAPYGEVGTDG
jgi:hypothetical protein